MDGLVARFAASLERGKPDLDALRSAGDPDPAKAAGSFERALGQPELAAQRDRWLPALLRAARPGFGAQCLEDLARCTREARGRPLDVGRTPALPTLLGSSNFLARLLLRHPEWVDSLEGPLPAAPSAPVEADWTAIRRAKYDGLLRIAARDLLGRSFVDSLGELSDLADRCIVAGLACSAQERDLPPPALLALGKLGGRELNFSSDVDLLFLHAAPPNRSEVDHSHATAELIRHFKRHLEAPSEDGFGYRVDLDLRPEGSTGVLSNSVDAAIVYYETFGAEWERQMLIRLRALAGPAPIADAFCRSITPFVYRRLIDPGVLSAVRDMKSRIESERRDAGRDIEANLKEGPGGIRDVEFLVQSLQLFYGGRHAGLRTGNVLAALAAIDQLGLLPDATVAALADAYTWLRRAEHAVQLVEEQQTALFPRDAVAQIGLARRMGYTDGEAERARTRLLEDWTSVRGAVRQHFESLVLRGEA